MHTPPKTSEAAAQALEPRWETQAPLSLPSNYITLLKPLLESYLLSSTHLNNFIDVANGGPQAFLLQNLLRFPQAMSRSAIFGAVLHRVLQRAHTHLRSSGERRPSEDVLHDFELQLQQARLSEDDFSYLFEKGSMVLEAFLQQRYHTFEPSQRTEYNFRYQGVVINGARLTGAVDLLEIDQNAKTIIVTDYKTGKASHHWHGSSDFEKRKLHKYRQQLMMYKLLIENSRDFKGYTVTEGRLTFIEPDATGAITDLNMAFNADEMARFTQLIGVIWEHIQLLDLPETTGYLPNYQGILTFEEDLLSGAL
jgi:DNA helicase-2/ATP-dependent DNA helicase PcrA